MTYTTSRFTMLSLVCVMISACGAQATPVDVATETLAPMATETLTATPAPGPSPTLTLIPSETPIPVPSSLGGTIFMSNGSVRPFSSSVELRMAETFDLVIATETNSQGEYRLDDIQPGEYELWVLITTQASMLSGCSDIRPLDNMWKIGVSFEEDKGLTMENAYLSKALLLVEGLQGSGMQAKGFYAVLSNFEIVSGIENNFDVTLYCD